MSRADASDLNYVAVMAGPMIPGFDPHPAQPCQVVRVHDGDTVLVRIDYDTGVSSKQWIRLENYNSPELHGSHPDLAKEATKALEEFLSLGPIWVKLTGAMTFARQVGRIFAILDGKPVDASEYLQQYNVVQGQ